MSRMALKQTDEFDAVQEQGGFFDDFDINVPPRPIKRPNLRVLENPYLDTSAKDEVRPASKRHMTVRFVACVAVAAFLLVAFAQIGRLSEISANAKKMSLLGEEINRLEEGYESNLVRLSLLENPDRVRDEAINRLGMIYPEEGQIRVVSMPGLSSNSEAKTADNSGAGEVSP